MKPSSNEVIKVFQGLSIAAARARELAVSHGKDELLDAMPRHQRDAVRQHLLNVEKDVETVLRIMTRPGKA